MTLQELIALRSVQTGDGLDSTPRLPGIYVVINRLTGRGYVGSAQNLRARCRGHLSTLRRGYTTNGLMRRDLQLHGAEHFDCVVLETFPSLEAAGGKEGLVISENEWIVRLGTHRESLGYNALLYGQWTKGASLRDRERKLKHNDRSYCLLHSVDLYDPIADVLLDSWTREPRVTERWRATKG